MYIVELCSTMLLTEGRDRSISLVTIDSKASEKRYSGKDPKYMMRTLHGCGQSAGNPIALYLHHVDMAFRPIDGTPAITT